MHSKWSVKVPRACSYTLGCNFLNLFFLNFQDMGQKVSWRWRKIYDELPRGLSQKARGWCGCGVFGSVINGG